MCGFECQAVLCGCPSQDFEALHVCECFHSKEIVVVRICVSAYPTGNAPEEKGRVLSFLRHFVAQNDLREGSRKLFLVFRALICRLCGDGIV